MRKLLLLVLCVFMLAGCSSAKTSVGDEMMFKVGEQTFTKQDTYEAMLDSDGGNSLMNIIMEWLCKKEVVDGYEEGSLELIKTYKENFGVETDEELVEYVSKYGYPTYESFLEFCQFVTRLDILVRRYVADNVDKYAKDYYPVVAVQIYLENENLEKADEIIEELKKGTVSDVCEKYNLRSQPATTYIAGLGTNENLTEALKKEDDVVLYAGNTILYKMAKGVDALKEDFIDGLSKNDTIIAEAYNYYLKKHNLTFHDEDLKKLFEQNFADMLK